jgi:hypothetical protein
VGLFFSCILWGRGGGASSCERHGRAARRGFFSSFFLPRRLSLPSSPLPFPAHSRCRDRLFVLSYLLHCCTLQVGCKVHGRWAVSSFLLLCHFIQYFCFARSQKLLLSHVDKKQEGIGSRGTSPLRRTNRHNIRLSNWTSLIPVYIHCAADISFLNARIANETRAREFCGVVNLWECECVCY